MKSSPRDREIPLPPALPDPEHADGPTLGRLTFPWELEDRAATQLRFRQLRPGCYLARFTPTAGSHYDGTLRVERVGTNTTASGDLYVHQRVAIPVPVQLDPRRQLALAGALLAARAAAAVNLGYSVVSVRAEPNPALGIPIFARSRYRYYLRVTQILEWVTTKSSFALGFEMHRYDSATNTFTREKRVKATMAWTSAPAGYPSAGDYLTGDVFDESGERIGSLTLGWVSSYLRKATIELDRVRHSEELTENGSGFDWQDVFEPVGWQITVDSSDANVAEPSGESWSEAECHARMLELRDASNLDTEWRYHLLAVRRIDTTPRGVMFDAYASDSNNVPREGAVIASHWQIPNTLEWGSVRNQRFGTATAVYFRTAVHELGHAQGLAHNSVDTGFMNTTEAIAAAAGTFPNNVTWAHAPDDQKRLRHLPDPWVRPGGIPFGASYGNAPISPNDDEVDLLEGITLEVEPLLEVVPIGAPVRVNFALRNDTLQPMLVPASLQMRDGHVRGFVTGPSGTARSFQSLIVQQDEGPKLRLLQPGERLTHSATLLRGPEGALFPSEGLHQIEIQIYWELGEQEVYARGTGSLLISPATTDSHAKAARRLLSSPDALLVLAIGGDHLEEGIAAFEQAHEDPVLRPHVAFVKARRLGSRFRARRPDREAAMQLISEGCVMSPAEMSRAAELVRASDHGELRTRATDQLKKLLDRVSSSELLRSTISDL